MSLDIYLVGQSLNKSKPQILIRQNGQTVEISREEWDVKCPGVEPSIVYPNEDSFVIYSANITHNMCPMAKAANIYDLLWRGPENNIKKAHQLVEPLLNAISLMVREPAKFIELNPSNGWGSYDDFLPWLVKLAAKCAEYPDAEVEVSV